MATIVMTEDLQKLADVGLFNVDILHGGWEQLNDNFYLNTKRKDFVTDGAVFAESNVAEFFEAYLTMSLTEDQLSDITGRLNACGENHTLKVIQDFYLEVA